MVDLGYGSKFKIRHKDRNIIINVRRSNELDNIIDNDALFMIIILIILDPLLMRPLTD